MNCIIIEDEHHAAKHLENQLALTSSKVNVQATIDSVKNAVSWLKSNTTDLIFLDVQLGDGLSFEIFDHVQVKTPVIFTTSYDQYAIKAFEVNSIAYLLKPVKAQTLRSAIDKYTEHYSADESGINDKIISVQQDYQKRFFTQAGSAIKSISADDVSYFRVQDKRHLIMVSRDGQQHLLDNTLERLEQRLDPEQFFRINRQFIIHIKAIQRMSSQDRGRIKVETAPECKEEMLVSIEKISLFKNWLNK